MDSAGIPGERSAAALLAAGVSDRQAVEVLEKELGLDRLTAVTAVVASGHACLRVPFRGYACRGASIQ